MIENVIKGVIDGLVDKLIADEAPLSQWILATGFWRDVGIWIDTEDWVD